MACGDDSTAMAEEWRQAASDHKVIKIWPLPLRDIACSSFLLSFYCQIDTIRCTVGTGCIYRHSSIFVVAQYDQLIMGLTESMNTFFGFFLWQRRNDAQKNWLLNSEFELTRERANPSFQLSFLCKQNTICDQTHCAYYVLPNQTECDWSVSVSRWTETRKKSIKRLACHCLNFCFPFFLRFLARNIFEWKWNKYRRRISGPFYNCTEDVLINHTLFAFAFFSGVNHYYYFRISRKQKNKWIPSCDACSVAQPDEWSWRMQSIPWRQKQNASVEAHTHTHTMNNVICCHLRWMCVVVFGCSHRIDFKIHLRL